MTLVTVDIPKTYWPGSPLNVNDWRGDTRYLHRAVAPWRELGTLMARMGNLPRPVAHPVRIFAEFTFATNRRRDTANLYLTIKALIDGLVDYGTLTGDHDGLIEGPWLRRVWPNGSPRIRLLLQPLEPGHLGVPLTTIARRETTDA